MQNVQLIPVFYGQGWSAFDTNGGAISEFPSTQKAAMEADLAFLGDISHSSFMTQLNNYYNIPGTPQHIVTYEGGINTPWGNIGGTEHIDNRSVGTYDIGTATSTAAIDLFNAQSSPAPNTNLDAGDDTVANMLYSAIGHPDDNGVVVPTQSINRLYIVFTPPGTTLSCGADTQAYAWHTCSDGVNSNTINPSTVNSDLIYAVIPYDPNFAHTTMATSHELAEAITDPITTFDGSSGWGMTM